MVVPLLTESMVVSVKTVAERAPRYEVAERPDALRLRCGTRRNRRDARPNFNPKTKHKIATTHQCVRTLLESAYFMVSSGAKGSVQIRTG